MRAWQTACQVHVSSHTKTSGSWISIVRSTCLDLSKNALTLISQTCIYIYNLHTFLHYNEFLANQNTYLLECHNVYSQNSVYSYDFWIRRTGQNLTGLWMCLKRWSGFGRRDAPLGLPLSFLAVEPYDIRIPPLRSGPSWHLWRCKQLFVFRVVSPETISLLSDKGKNSSLGTCKKTICCELQGRRLDSTVSELVDYVLWTRILHSNVPYLKRF